MRGAVLPNPDRTLAALADPTRRALVERLSLGEARVGELAAPFAMSLAAVSKHLAVLERAGLVRRRAEGRARLIALEPEPLRELEAWARRQHEPRSHDGYRAKRGGAQRTLSGTSPIGCSRSSVK
ncbi:MAG: metalloregulator ArsR/SmtB family transcription factor [Sorangiineae bacterium]|nr:metalloregulator ArsR/SmtB family transcription factor [Sorangiineae bacterium]